MRTVTIEVTQADIDSGDRGACYRCPVAIAMARAGLVKPKVDEHSFTFGGAFSGYDTYYPLPQKAIDFIHHFDSEHDRFAKPFTFTVEVP